MVGILALLGTLSGSISQTIKNYFEYKRLESEANKELKLAQIVAEKESIIASSKADTDQRANYLNATTRNFRQGTFYWMSAIILYSIIRPNSAADMWHNFSLIPEWVQYIYLGMLSVTWGLPIARENIGLMFGSVSKGMAARREYKLEKAKINRDKLYENLRLQPEFKKGLSQRTVDMLEEALNAGETG